MITPTIGRKVWYWPPLTHGGNLDSKQPFDATVCFVFQGDAHINIAYRDHLGRANHSGNVPLWQGEGDRPEGNFAEWMPFQIGQAKAAKP